MFLILFFCFFKVVPSVLLSTEGERVAHLVSCIVNVVTGKWIFKHKPKAHGSLVQYKTRWVLRGFTQHPRVYYDKTFSPMVKPGAI